MNKVEKAAREIMNQLSEEELVSFLQQDYSSLIKFLELRVKSINEDTETKDKTDRVVNEVIAMTLETLKDFLVDINSKKGEK
ncbi:hypothetical protein [Veillonella sp. 3310]|uniref:hypothetical protein n=1 Tax=Veillonella sp. 3310 TaxID=2490956 RepID=UPI000FD650ED|nr:hypothetical protein [Veillonella sp. 3310]